MFMQTPLYDLTSAQWRNVASAAITFGMRHEQGKQFPKLPTGPKTRTQSRCVDIPASPFEDLACVVKPKINSV
jgi:hypothetical protein